MADCGEDQRKSRQDRKRKQRQSASEGIIKKVKGNDAERRLAKQRQRMANHRARETGKQRHQQVISIIGSLNHRIFPAQVTSLSLCSLHCVIVRSMVPMSEEKLESSDFNTGTVSQTTKTNGIKGLPFGYVFRSSHWHSGSGVATRPPWRP